MSDENRLTVRRTFDVPRERVFDAWTDPEQVDRWWGPDGFTTTTDEMDVGPGGVWRFVMVGPDGDEYQNRIVYEEVERPERLAYIHGSPDDPEQFRVTVAFDERGDETELTMEMRFPSAADLDEAVEFGADEGARQTLAKLADHLTSGERHNMGTVFADMAMSLDGYVAGPNDSRENALGDDGERLHGWLFDLATFRERHGEEGGETGRDDEIVAESFENVGAYVMGRRMFDNGEGPWGNDPFDGYWGDDPPFRAPVFVLTHHPREPLEMEGGTTFHFVTDGLENALERAREAAGEADVRVAGGREHHPTVRRRGTARRTGGPPRPGPARRRNSAVRAARRRTDRTGADEGGGLARRDPPRIPRRRVA